MLQDSINRTIQIMLDLADIADEKQDTPFGSELGLGYRAFSGYVRAGVVQLIKLKDELHSVKERADYYKACLEENEELIEEIFGRKDAYDFFTEEEKARIRAVAEDITNENRKMMEEEDDADT